MDHTHIRPYFLAIVITGAFVLTFYLLKPFLGALAIAIIFAVIFTPLHERFVRMVRGRRSIAASLTLLLVFIAIAIPLVFISGQLIAQIENVYIAVSNPDNINRAQVALLAASDELEGVIPGAGVYLTEVVGNLGNYSRDLLTWVVSNAGSFFSGALRFFLLTFIFFISLYYLLREGPATRASVVRLSPLTESETISILNRLTLTINSVVKGNLTVAGVQGTLVAVGFAIFGVPNAILWGTFAAIGALIPSVGTALVLIPGIAYLFFIGSTGSGIGLAIWGFVIVGFVDNILNPLLIGGRASIHPLLILLAVLGGLAFFGPAGIFLGPIVISFLLSLLSIYSPTDDTRISDTSLEQKVHRR